MGIAVALNQDIDHVSILVHSPPEIVPLSLDVHEELVQVPDVSQPSLPAPEISGVVWTELPTPLPDRLVRDDDSSLRQQLLDVPETQAESVIQPDSVPDDFGRKSVSAVTVRIRFHPRSLAGIDSS
jgi:hypothetical protein